MMHGQKNIKKQHVHVEKMPNKRMLKQTATAAREGIRKDHVKDGGTKLKKNLNIMEIYRKQAMARHR